MTQVEQAQTAASGAQAVQPKEGRRRPQAARQNVGQGERAASVAGGAILAALGLSRASIPGLVIAGLGGAMIYRGASGHCPMYGALGVNTAEPQRDLTQRGIHVEAAYLINRSPQELYQYWRNFENLPRIMSHLHSVRVLDERRSHWVADAPKIAGGKVEWDAIILDDQPNSKIAWRSTEGSELETAGQIRFTPAVGDRGTEVHVWMQYLPPAGRLGHWVATVFGESPRRQMQDDLRNFKRLMETGEIPTVIGQPRGTCLGHGKIQQS